MVVDYLKKHEFDHEDIFYYIYDEWKKIIKYMLRHPYVRCGSYKYKLKRYNYYNFLNPYNLNIPERTYLGTLHEGINSYEGYRTDMSGLEQVLT